MKKSEIIALYNGINSCMGLVGVIWGYALNRNLSILKPEIEALQKAITPSKEFSAYDQKRVDIVKKYATKDDKDQFIIKGNSYDVKGQESVIEAEVLPLKEEYKDAIASHEKQVEEYNKLIEEETNVELYKVKLENVPKDITAAQMKEIFPIIEE